LLAISGVVKVGSPRKKDRMRRPHFNDRAKLPDCPAQVQAIRN
jgi:hypothetical protein